MAFVHGKGIFFGAAVAGATAPTTNLSTKCNKVDWPRTADTAETSAFGTTSKTHLPGLIGSTCTIEGLWDTTVDAFLDPKLGTIISIFYAPAGSGTAGYYADAILTSYNPPGSLTEAVKFTAAFLITGAVTRATVTAP
jgi:hypothetical protein